MLDRCFKAYDVRATYPEPLNEDGAWSVGFATARFLAERAAEQGLDSPGMRHVVVGRDMRRSSPSLAEALIEGMLDFGANVIDIGLVDTPAVYFAINHFGASGGVQVTASHNPAQYNGFKVSQVKARPVGQGTGLERIKAYAVAASRSGGEHEGGMRSGRDVWQAYRAHLLRLLDPCYQDGSRKVRIAIDASNGMAGVAVPKLFGGLPGLDIEAINFDTSTGGFVHEPNPLVEANLAQVREAVVRGKADFGVCFDGDADRCMVIDEQGTPVGCDLLLAAMVGRVLKASPGSAVVYDLRSSRSVAEAIREAGGEPVESRVGHVFMKAALAQTAAPIGGELSGHFYFADMWNTDSGVRALIEVLNLLAASGRPLSACIAPFRRYAQSGEINFENPDTAGTLERLKQLHATATMQELDGLSIDTGAWWANIRRSNTEPLLRLNLEARDAAAVAAAVAGLEPVLGHRVDH